MKWLKARSSPHSFSGLVMVLLLFLSCHGESPTAPPAAPNASGIWGQVLQNTGGCIADAVVEIVNGPGAGRKTIQKGPCDAWDGEAGYVFGDLPSGVTVKLRATKEGYRPQELEAVTRIGAVELNFVLLDD
jgi:hypothetical protein